MIGQTLGHYRIDSKLGEGGMGVVYRAFDTHLDRAVAIKVLRPDATASPDRKRRFVQEAKSASALNHPGIVHIYDIDSANLPDGPTDFIAMEFVPGKTLDQYIGKGGLSLKDALKFGIQIRRTGARPRRRNRPPRSEAGQHHRGRRCPCEIARLRPGQAD
jgi:serine/threonine protein kinase